MKQKKLRKPLSLLLALALVLTMFAGLSITAYADEPYEEITVTISNGEGSATGTNYSVEVSNCSFVPGIGVEGTFSISENPGSASVPNMTKVELYDGGTLKQTFSEVSGTSDSGSISYEADSAPTSLTFKIYYSAGNAVSIGTFTGGTVTADKTSSVASGTTVTLTVTPSAGYQFGSLTVKNGDTAVETTTVTEGSKYTFTMPASAVTVSATFNELATSGEVDLDLESDMETPSSTTIDQYYIKTTADKTTVNNKIKVSWVNQSIGIKVASAKKWNPTSLTWDTDTDKNGKASVAEGTNVTTFTFTNYSTKAFTIEPSFAINSDLSETVKGSFKSATYDQTSYTVAAVDVDSSTGIADSKYFVDGNTDNAVDESKLPSASVVATLNMDASKFDGASATSSAQKYGTYTFTLNAESEN